jgi:hypothetical protein
MSKQRTFIHVEELGPVVKTKKPRVKELKEETGPEILGCETCGLKTK